MIFENKKTFEDFLKSNLKAKCYDVNVYLEDLENRFYETGNSTYELNGFETKDGTPITIGYYIKKIKNDYIIIF